MHELDADRAAIRLPQDLHDLTQRGGFASQHEVDEDRLVPVGFGEAIGCRVEFRMMRRPLQPQRIKLRLQMPAHPVGADQHQRPQRGDRRRPHLIRRQPARRGRRRRG